MVLANFFDKSAMAASHVLSNYDRSDFEGRLGETTVEIAFDYAAIHSEEGKATLEMVIKLLARMYPKLIITELGLDVDTYRVQLEGIAQGINPHIHISNDQPSVSVCIGNTAIKRDVPVFYLGSDNWIINFSDTKPVGSGSSANPFAAGAVACYGAANVFRHVFKDQLNNAEYDTDFSLSLLDYELKEPGEINDTFSIGEEKICLKETAFVGLGAIGNGAIWALSKIAVLEGTIYLIDPEEVELSNLQRYVLTDQGAIGKHKTDIAMELLANSGLALVPYRGDWAAFLNNRDNWKVDMALVAVDSAEHRIGIQASMPKHIINAWTQSDDLGISRHFDFDKDACLGCLYPPVAGIKSESLLIVESFGLPKEEVIIRQMLYNNDPIDENWINKIAEAKSMDKEVLLPYVNRPIRDFYTKVVCGGIMLGEVHKQAETPMAFQSALAGILLAAELIIENETLRLTPMDNVTKLDLLNPVKEYLNEMVLKPTGSKCICQDDDFKKRYQDKYAE